ncbi:MAG: ABC transporter substrate-binding protein [Armatimonadota bacterium]|nr:ABC transporter substrate-binding protein [Armatimonadota bacterium]MDR7450796.1 ABC transporter substrate-binding protein [Armatimonadota bacterium]MDR7466152.1 ABC transporter substrate-binding protein [Armatimonadota bacterium]MDR7493811.1 ABC transporter substrate-binding protein [Armatimonadota bacterium]MDR7499028.1 ABC transporter substrate-binding protein [Armatimonadota bacterium]
MLRLTLACGPYDRTDALRTGLVRPEGIDLIYVPIQSPPEIFARMLSNQAFDVSEMSCAHALIRRARGDFPFVAIPVFPSRMFRHGYIFVNTASGIRTPRHLEGTRVGVPEYSQTAAVWIRGLLQHDYGVRLETLQWVSGGVNAPGRPDVLVNRPEGVPITRIQDRTLNELLVNGEIDALIGARRPDAFGRDPRIVRLFPEYRQLEREYYARTRIFPIMHTVVIREALYREQRWIAESLYKAFVQAKAWCLAQMKFSSALRYTLPWLQADLEEMAEVFGDDPWPYGLEANRHVLTTLVQYLVEQRLLTEPVALEELFVPLTLLGE